MTYALSDWGYVNMHILACPMKNVLPLIGRREKNVKDL
jgi:hypothetical protein